MSARESLLETLSVLKDCLNDRSVIDLAPTDVAHNARARMLRQGLAVLIFSTLETFIRERTGEVLKSFTNPDLEFSDLSPALQKATTLGALEGVRFRLKFQSPTNRITWLISKLASISGAVGNVQNLSDHSFGHGGSNIDEGDVEEILKSFGIFAPWQQMTTLTMRLGVSVLDTKSEFEAVKRRRHSSAHALTGQIPYADLENSVRSSLGICLAFDLLLSHSRGLFNLKAGPGVNSRPQLLHSDVGLAFVMPRAGTSGFALRKEPLPPSAARVRRATVKIFPDELDAVTYGKQYAFRRQLQLIVLDPMSVPVTWATW